MRNKMIKFDIFLALNSFDELEANKTYLNFQVFERIEKQFVSVT